jgi:hypothetical protein
MTERPCRVFHPGLARDRSHSLCPPPQGLHEEPRPSTIGGSLSEGMPVPPLLGMSFDHPDGSKAGGPPPQAPRGFMPAVVPF